MSKFIRMQLICLKCKCSRFAITNSGDIICPECKSTYAMKGKYSENDEEKILEKTNVFQTKIVFKKNKG